MSLLVISRFKNERHILYEWIHHYLLEGVDHFFLIDDHSNDEYKKRCGIKTSKGKYTFAITKIK